MMIVPLAPGGSTDVLGRIMAKGMSQALGQTVFVENTAGAAGTIGVTRAERAAIGVMHPGRVDVIGAGALVLDRIMIRFGFAEVLVSEHDILDGIAWSLVP